MVPAKILSFGVEPEIVSPGETVRVSWTTSDANRLVLLYNGSPVSVPNDAWDEGTRESQIWSETTIELVVTGSDGESVSEKRTVGIAPPAARVVSFSAREKIIEAGSRTVLRWETADAQSVSIKDEAGTSIVENSPLSIGEVEVQPARTTTYQLRAEGADDSTATASVEVRVQPVIVAFGSDTGEPAAPGKGVALDWEVRGASTITVSNLEGYEETMDVDPTDRGTVLVPMGSQGKFRLTAVHGDLEAQQDFELPVLLAPRIRSFVADKPFWTEGLHETLPVTLSWETERATEIELNSDTLGRIDLVQKSPESDSLLVLPTTATRFTFTARNAAGEDSAEVEVHLVPLPVINSFAGIPARVGAGESIRLVWSTTDAVAVSIRDEFGTTLLADGKPQDSIETVLAADTRFILRAWNAAGDWVEEEFLVAVGAPINQLFEPSRSHVAVGEGFDLRWRNFGGNTLEIRDQQNKLICSVSTQEEVFEGQCPHVETQTGTFTYTLTVRNGIGESDTAVTDVLVTNGPLINRFEVNPVEITEGDQVTVSWEVLNDAAGRKPTLQLTDGTTNYPLNDRDPNEDSKTFVVNTVGEVDLKLEATTVEGTTQTTRRIRVHARPDLQLQSSPAAYDGLQPLTLSWTTKGTEKSLKLYTFDRLGNRIEPPLYDVPAGERATGSISVTPPLWDPEVKYLLVGENDLGVSDEAEISVEIGEPVAVFEADPPEVVDGDPVDLVWDVRLAEQITLDLLGFEVTENGNPFIDIRSTGTDLGLGQNENLWATIDLGAMGLFIPWGKELFDYVRVTERGFLTFGESLRDDRRGNVRFEDLHYLWTSSSTGQNYFELSIAAYWGGIETRAPNSSVKGQLVKSPDGRHQYIVQWTHANRDQAMIDRVDTDMTFQVAIYENGEVDLRYDAMLPADEPQANGGRASIGYMFEGEWVQNPVYGPHEEIHFGGNTIQVLDKLNEPYPGGLNNRSFSLRHPNLPLSGRHSYVPAKSETRVLTAIGASNKKFEANVIVHPRATVKAIAPTGEVQEKQPFSLSWTSTDANKIEVLDRNNQVRCTVTDPSEVASGSCQITENGADFYTYTVRATGALGHTVEDTTVVQVYAEFDIYEFDVSAEEVGWKRDLVVSWRTKGVGIFKLTANGVEVPVPSSDWDQGQSTFNPEAETLYRLEVRSLDGRSRVQERFVTVRTMDFNSASVDKGAVLPGESVTFTWDVTSYTGEPPAIFINSPLREVDASIGSPHAFRDIKGVGTYLEMGECPDAPSKVIHSEGCKELIFPNGFIFPFGGEKQSSMWVFVDGIASFDGPPGMNTLNNRSLPKLPGEEGAFVNFAPFWDNLFWESGSTGDIWYLLDESDPDNRHLIVQWTGARFALAATSDLNFQIVLFEDGSFEYRYSTMSGDTEAFALRALGTSATVGYQVPGGHVSFTIHQGGEASATGDPFPGGFAGRSWRAEALDTSTGKVSVLDTHDYELCAKLGTFVECKSFPIDATWEIRKFEADKERVRANEPVVLSWETYQGESISLWANGVEIDVSHLNKENGNITLYPLEWTTYVLKLHSLWRTKEAEVTVEVDTFDNLVIASDRVVSVAGEPVTISWDLDTLAPGEPKFDLNLPFMVEVDDAPYIPLAPAAGGSGAVVPNLTTRNRLSTLDFPEGFTFPYYGKEYSKVHISNMGYLSFDDAEASSTATANTSAKKIPGTPSMAAKHLAVFWDGIYRNTTQGSDVYWKFVQDVINGDHIIIDYHNFAYGSSGNVGRDQLNFQVVLYEDGRFEYRFGEMSSTSTTYDHRARGSQAMIGYQDPTGTLGQIISWATDHPEGLTDRSWRFTPPQIVGKQLTFHPDVSFVPQICAELGGERECVESQPVNVLRPGDLLVSELMLDPVTGDQWFEVRNMTMFPVDLQNFVIETDTGSHTITSSVPLAKGEYAVLAEGPNVDFTPDYVHGLRVFATDGYFRLGRSGTTVASVTWDVSWPHKTGHSFTLDSMLHLSSLIGANATKADFCTSSEAYGEGGNHGSPGGHALPCNPLGPYAVDFNAPVEAIDISGLGVELFPGEEKYNKYDNSTEGMVLPFTFPFYGDNFPSLWVHTNGFVTFKSLTSTFTTNAQIPATTNPSMFGILAPFWDALRPSDALDGGMVEAAHLTVDGKKVTVIRWHTTPNSGRTWEANADIDFQLQLWEDGTFDFVYNEINDGHYDSRGHSATIGFQKQAVQEGYRLSYNDRQTQIPVTGRVVRMTPIP